MTTILLTCTMTMMWMCGMMYRAMVDDMRIAAKNGADMITFPELQLSPFFPKYHSRKRQCVDLSCLCFSNMFC